MQIFQRFTQRVILLVAGTIAAVCPIAAIAQPGAGGYDTSHSRVLGNVIFGSSHAGVAAKLLRSAD